MKQISSNSRDRNQPFRAKHNPEQLKTNKNET